MGGIGIFHLGTDNEPIIYQFHVYLVSQTTETDPKLCLFSTKSERERERERSSRVAEAHVHLHKTGGVLVRMPYLLFRVPVISGRMGKL